MTHAAPQVAIVIPTWNRRQDLLECLASAYAMRYPNYHVVVVDNGSDDGSPGAVRTSFPQTTVVALERNVGAARASNVGFARALDGGADYCLRLDSDTVMDSDFLRQLVTSMQSDPTLGAVMGKILYYDDPERIWSLGGERVGHFFFNHNVGQDEMDGPAFAQAQTIDYIWSTGMLISRAALEATGGFDPDFTVYYEEMDLSERLRAAGFRLQAVPQARMWHKVGELAHGEWVAFNWARGKMLFFRKHSRGWQRLALVVYAYAYALMRAVKPKAGAGNRGPLRAALSGLTAGRRVHLRSS